MMENDPMQEYEKLFGEAPPIFGHTSDPKLMDNIIAAVKEKRPLWTFYSKTDPAADESIDL